MKLNKIVAIKIFGASVAASAVGLGLTMVSASATVVSQPVTVKITGITSTQDQTAYNTPNNDSMNISASAVFGIKGAKTVSVIETFVNGVMVAKTPSATYPGGSALQPVVDPAVVAGGSTHTYVVKIVGASGAVLATSAPVTMTATLYPPLAPWRA